jgi:DNA-binding CsgD family transcriptional regulator
MLPSDLFLWSDGTTETQDATESASDDMTEKDDPSRVASGESGPGGQPFPPKRNTGNGANGKGTLAEADPHFFPPADSSLEWCVLDHVERGVIALDATGAVLIANLDARHVLEDGHSLRVRDRRLEFVDPYLNDRLSHLLAARARASTDVRGFVARLQQDKGEGLLRVLVTPLGNHTANSDIAVLIFVFDTHGERVISHEVLRDLYDLTAAQAAVAAYLFEGHRVEQTAQRLGLSINTVRSHLKHIFAKCEVQSQAELMHLLDLGPHSV